MCAASYSNPASIAGTVGVLDEGLYTAENVAAVYDEVLRRAHLDLCRRPVGDPGRHLARRAPTCIGLAILLAKPLLR